jgi:triosephosphate isomerase
VDGALVGGASLKADEFVPIVRAYLEVQSGVMETTRGIV